MTITFISYYEVPSGGPTTVDLTSGGAWANYDDLLILVSARSTYDRGSVGFLDLNMRFNDSASGYTMKHLVGNGSSTYSYGGTNVASGNTFTVNDNGTTANTFGNGQIYIPNLNSSTTKSFSADGVHEDNSSAAEAADQVITAGLWSGTDPIIKVTFFMQLAGTNYGFTQGSSFTVYGIKKGSDGTTTVS